MQRANFASLTHAACVVDGCGLKSIKILSGFEATDFCLCPAHHAEAVKKEKIFNVFEDKTKDPQAVARFENRKKRSGLSADAFDVLGISIDKPEPLPLNTTEAMKICQHHEKANPQGTLIISGFNGIGKSIAAQWCAWKSRGRFLKRSEWCQLTTWEKDSDEVFELMNQHGTLVLDEVAQKGSSYESPESIKIVNMIACERHDAKRSTILTTRRTKREFFDIFENDVLDRTRAHEILCGSGFFNLKGKSLR
tara:strand:+ start:8879 stop:9631 length:753 start_codon:yes stop_codon:yes gene_type:complete